MHPAIPTRFIDPALLAGISHLDLVAKTVVDGFVAGLHRSPDFGFSQEFAEYRAYTPGDDLRHVDWNVFARTERTYLKRYRGETNSLLTVLLDASQSMEYASHSVSKMDYARYIAASLFYLAIHSQRVRGSSRGLWAGSSSPSRTRAPTSASRCVTFRSTSSGAVWS